MFNSVAAVANNVTAIAYEPSLTTISESFLEISKKSAPVLSANPGGINPPAATCPAANAATISLRSSDNAERLKLM